MCSYTDKVSLPKRCQAPLRRPWRSALQELRLPLQASKQVTCNSRVAAPWATQDIQKHLLPLFAACTSVLRASIQVVQMPAMSLLAQPAQPQQHCS